MRVFITGAAGVIGESVALAYRRAGHEVLGLVRNPSTPTAKNLEMNEVTLVVGDLTKPETYQDVAATADVIIQAAVDWYNMVEVEVASLKTLLAAASKRGKKKVVFIYTSGTLAYPSAINKVYGEDDPVDSTPGPLLHRLQHEQQVLSSDIVHGVVVRPCYVYGGRATNFVQYFQGAESGKVTVENPQHVNSEIHIHDLAEAYLKIGEAAPSIVSGQIFNVSDDSRNTNLQVASRLAQAAGYKGEIQEIPTQNPIFAKSVLVDYRKLTRLLGWIPRHKNMLDEAEILYKAWKARQQ